MAREIVRHLRVGGMFVAVGITLGAVGEVVDILAVWIFG